MEETVCASWLDLLCSSGSHGRSCFCVEHIGFQLCKPKIHPFISTETPGMAITDCHAHTHSHKICTQRKPHGFFFNKRKHTGIKSNTIIATLLGLTAVILKRKLFTAYSTFIPFEKSSNVIHSWFICPVAPMRIKGPNWWLCSNQSWAWPIETTTELETPLSPKSETGDTVFSAITPH